MRKALYFVKEAIRGFYHAKLMTSVAILTAGVCLFFVGVVIILGINLRQWLRETSSRATVVAYLEDESAADSTRARAILSTVETFPQVAGVAYVDRRHAWRNFERVYGSELLEAVDENPFPASLEISVDRRHLGDAAIRELVSALEALDGIEGVVYLAALVRRLEKLNRYFVTGSAVVLVLVVVALNFMISNTVRLTIYAREELVSNMRFVGATDAYIQAPFILEGMLQGLIGALLAAGAVWSLRVFLPGLPLQWGGRTLLLILVGLGVLFGWIGSISAVRKFLS